MVARDKKNFGLLNENGEEIGTFTGAQPRDAALKVANKDVKNIPRGCPPVSGRRTSKRSA